MGKRVFPQDSSINSVSSTPSLHIRACSLPVDNTIKNDYLPYGNYSSRCVVHMDSPFASHVSIQAVEVFRTAVPMETSLCLDLCLQKSYYDHKILAECLRAVKRSEENPYLNPSEISLWITPGTFCKVNERADERQYLATSSVMRY